VIRLALYSALGVVAVLTLTAAQAGTVTIPLDLGALIGRAVNYAGYLLVALLLWIGKGALKSVKSWMADVSASLSKLTDSVGGLERETRTVKQELFGVNGDNGMRSDVRETKEITVSHALFLERVAERLELEGPKR
jgi:hypothetical protein